MDKKKIEVYYKNPLHLLWAIPTSVGIFILLIFINIWLTLKQSWIFFQIFINKDDKHLRKKWNEQLDSLKMKR